MARFVVDLEAVEKARRELRVDLEVRVFIGRYQDRDGRYIGHKNGVHRIGVDADLPPGQASKTIWHELMHAKQAECLGGRKGVRPPRDKEMREVGLTRRQAVEAKKRRYRKTPLEREAVAAEKRHSRLPLAC